MIDKMRVTRAGIRQFILSGCLLLSATLITGNAQAFNEKAASGDSTALPISRLEPFVVNLTSFDRYLQTIVSLQLTNAEAAEKIKQLTPIVRHVIIMALSAKESTDMLTTAGKKLLIDELREKLNKALTQWDKEMVSDVFFENFVVQ
ncbi:flagellar basal body-associated FliL family protein [Undibacterium sp. Ji22W]|uniref:flagellar basal body-associated FliL family protein n=1 Tax=Undibacterium sp. Ji22W TaxID=3413038 RepID=UPI003BF15396